MSSFGILVTDLRGLVADNRTLVTDTKVAINFGSHFG